MGDLLLKMAGIEKSFPGVHALNQAQFELRAGEVHALVGENGAGKSTLMKILSGIYSKDAGSVRYQGKEVEITKFQLKCSPSFSGSVHQVLVEVFTKF